MIDFEKYTELLQWHNGVEHFDYDLAVDWAIEMIRKGIETENMFIIASFTKPVYRNEIKPYIYGVLKDLGLEEKIGEYSVVSNVYFHAQQIVDNVEVRRNLKFLFDIHLDNNSPDITQVFYLLQHGWNDLESVGYNYYYEGATLDNIESMLKMECQKFIDKYVYGGENPGLLSRFY